MFGRSETKNEVVEISEREKEKKINSLVSGFIENKIKASDVKELEDLLTKERSKGKIQSKHDAILSKLEFDKLKETCRDDKGEYKYKLDKNLNHYVLYKKTNEYEAKRYSVKKEEFEKDYLH